LNPTKAIERVRPWWTRCKPTVHYMMETEAHVYALAISASVLLAFYPFVVAMMSICRDLLHWRAAMDLVPTVLKDFFAGEEGVFLFNNVSATYVPRFHLTTLFLLLLTANGIFEPMEVALNKAWGVTQNRSYLKNQLVSLGLIFACGGLALSSILLTAGPFQWLHGKGWLADFLVRLIFKLSAVPISILALFLIYWLLPNRKVEPARVAPVAIVVGLILEGGKYVELLLAPLLERKFHDDYQVFRHSVTIVVLSALASLIILAGAHWTANHEKRDPLA